MSKRKLSPLVQAIAAYNALDERGRQELADYVRSQQPRRPKASSATGRQSRRRSMLTGQEVSTGAETASATTAGD